ncbi:hypothetical protein J8F10_13990 [Gemmata sp. G18]|uniref:Uncharacterized protein n=1 Tax=Gemmata palustris TaxID=2822762 RepID=A0ABS5BSY4_9BACT|nr:hypothetical protein [Gemmata palustris]MBP3956390.1 hypothetical protein [Gemmata palustris]
MLALAALTILLAADPKADQPVVVTKGDAFIVHALANSARQILFREYPPAAPLLMHTALPSGKLTVLFRSGTTIGIPIPMGLNRTPYSQTRIVGVTADAERLYVLVWSASWKVEDFGGAPPIKPPESDSYAVRVFWLADGSEVGNVPLGGSKRPKNIPTESMEAGPLASEKPGSVSVYGETLRFRGKELQK